MHKLLFALLFWLGSLTAYAHEPGNPTLPATPFSCNLPAPGNFHVTNITATSVSLQWNAVSGAAQYKLATTETVGGALVSVMTLPGATTATTVQNLQMGTQYLFTIWAVCGNGDESGNSGTTLATTYIVIDIIVQAQAPGTFQIDQNCPMSTNGTSTCGALNWGSTCEKKYFQITKTTFPTATEYFSACTEAELCNVPILPRIGMINTGNNAFTITGSNGNGCSGDIFLKYAGTTICSLTVGGPTSAGLPGRIYLQTSLPNGYAIYPAMVRERSEQAAAEAADKPTALNPFTDELQVSLPANAAPTDLTTLLLYDLSGRLVKSYQAPGDATQVSLPTADLPVGLYFLRVTDADGQSETLRVVKSQ